MSEVERGSFPFPICDGERETQAVTWLRNYSSYLAVGGFWNYLGLIGVYLRGTLLNLIVLMPLLIVTAVVLGLLHHPILNHAYWGLLAGIVIFMLSGSWLVLVNNLDHVHSGDDLASFRGTMRRLRRERPLGFAISLLLTICFVEASPRIIELARMNMQYFDFGWKSFASFIVAASSIVVGINRLLGYLGRFRRGASVVVLGLGSLLLPWIVALRLADYVVYGTSPSGWRLGLPFYCCVVIAMGLLACLVASIISPTAGWKTFARISGALLVTVVVGAASLCFAEWGRKIADDAASQYIGTLTRPLAKLARASPDHESMSSPAASAFKQFQEEKRTLDRFFDQNFILHDELTDASGKPVRIQGFGFYDSKMNREYFSLASRFLESGERLRQLEPSDQQTLSLAISEAAIESLAERLSPTNQECETHHERPNRKEGIPNEFNRLVLEELIANLTAPILEGDFRIETQTLSQQRKVLLSDYNDEAFFKLVRSHQIPIRMAIRFLKLTQRTSQLARHRQKPDAPDAARTGPRVFVDAMQRQEVDKLLTKHFWTQRLYRMPLVDLWRPDLNEHLITMAEIDKTEVDCIIKTSRHRMIISSFRLSALCRLIDRDGTVFTINRKPNATAPSLRSIPESLQENLRQLSNKLNEPWSVKNQVAINEAAGEVAKAFDFKDAKMLRSVALKHLISLATNRSDPQAGRAREILGELYAPSTPMQSALPENYDAMRIYRAPIGEQFDADSISRIVAAKYATPQTAEPLITRMVFGSYGNLNGLEDLHENLFLKTAWSRIGLLLLLAVCSVFFSWLFIDINETAAHGFYRDRLARAFLLQRDERAVLKPATDIRLSDLGNHHGKSSAPFHLINGAVNLQASPTPNLRDRQSDYFTFSKRFIGSPSTGYVATPVFESVQPNFSLASAMAISAGAASPNMGKHTNSLLVFLMTLMNLRLGFWVPNPSHLQGLSMPSMVEKSGPVYVNSLEEVFQQELFDIQERRNQVGSDGREKITSKATRPDTQHHLLGLAFSGGGIRSAAFNLGIVQVLHAKGIFPLVDYLSTVSGGGYLGAAISCAMRYVTEPPQGRDATSQNADPVFNSYRWRVPPRYFFREMTSQLTHRHRWLNISDGGHLENLGIYELLRRRCEVIIAGDAEADPTLDFPSLSALARYARIDLGVELQWLPGGILSEHKQQPRPHHGIAKIKYPATELLPEQTGFLIYFKASTNGDEDLTVTGYQAANPQFPHQSTADQFFDEGQFEAYRQLGEHIAREIIRFPDHRVDSRPVPFDTLLNSIERHFESR